MRWSWTSFAAGAAAAALAGTLVSTCAGDDAAPPRSAARPGAASPVTSAPPSDEPARAPATGLTPATPSASPPVSNAPPRRRRASVRVPGGSEPDSPVVSWPGGDVNLDPDGELTEPQPAPATQPAAKPRHAGPSAYVANAGRQPDPRWAGRRWGNARNALAALSWEAGTRSASPWIPAPASLLEKGRATSLDTENLRAAVAGGGDAAYAAVARAADAVPPQIAFLVETLERRVDGNVRLAAYEALLPHAAKNPDVLAALLRATEEKTPWQLGLRLYALDRLRELGPRAHEYAVGRLEARDYAQEDLPGLAASAVRSERIAAWMPRLTEADALIACATALRGGADWTSPPLSDLRREVPQIARRIFTSNGSDVRDGIGADLLVSAGLWAAAIDLALDRDLSMDARWSCLHRVGYWAADPSIVLDACVRVLAEPDAPEDLVRLAIAFLREEDLREPRVAGLLQLVEERNPSPYVRQDVAELRHTLAAPDAR